ncbi:MAG TPA: hypothetical protein VFW90_02820, partial [Candidatus Saccharimonadales bacterium]|nr:hypothetical protein [Candidatus Saccharimonadales bacterium]
MAKNDNVEKFKQHLEAKILDSEGVHHEFVSGMHGRKLDFDVIPDNDPLLREWIEAVTAAIDKLYPDIPRNKLALLSVANGTNRLVGPVAEKLGGGVTALLTEKESPKSVRLALESAKRLKELDPVLVVAIEDVGTKGTTSASAVRSARSAGAKR